ncbi:cell morphogenesis N-terminal-domain-containing protein [Abortiporus biennis]|nr:cell morphogenesis N-terminal-domain-containing protein [Abortiporus biennis]
MGSEGIQINIPDFDEDDFSSTPLFGRSQPGGIWGNSGSGLDSPTSLTPIPGGDRMEKSYFHSRGDSVASEDSSHSIQYTSRKLKSPFAHSAQSSIATTSSSPFTKKASFASLRNAFKSNKSNDPAPPVPVLDQQAYPVLKNPFNRSATSLVQSTHSRPSTHASPPHFRPSTPSSNESKYKQARSKGHSYARSQHSHSGSIFHFSDAGSDHGHGSSFNAMATPPPVPPFPNGFGLPGLYEEPDSPMDFEEKIVVDARTPSDFALHAIFIRFAASAENLINEFVRQPLDREPRLEALLASRADPAFDDMLQSLGKIAQKNAKPVVDSVRRWRKEIVESISSELHRGFSAVSRTRVPDSSTILAERKSLAATYLMCRALLAATQSLGKDSLSDAVGNNLEEMAFEQFKRPDVKTLTQSANYRTIADMYAMLLGNLANVRFESVTIRFLSELGPVAAGQVPKDSDFKFENLVKGLKHVKIDVWPPERFEEGAEFLEELSKSFDNAHGVRLKTVFAETLINLLHPIAKTAQAEVNHPEWAKAVELIFPKAKDMMGKPRYWQVAYPLAVTTLCVAPNEFFLKNWMSCFEAGLSKIKEKPYRMVVLNGMLRLIWVYLYRCHESGSTVTSKLESLLKHFFPPNRLIVVPQEERLEPFVCIVHFILSRHIDFGTEVCMELLQERIVNAGQFDKHYSNMSSERVTIAAQAILLSLHLFSLEEPTPPSWPSSSDFTQVPVSADYPSSADLLTNPITRAGVNELLEKSSSCLCNIATSCFQAIGRMSIFDDQWLSSQIGPNYEDAHSHIIRHHSDGVYAYPSQLSTAMHLLRTCFRSWPRCLHSSIPAEDAFDMLFFGVIHIEPAIAESATLALQRFMCESTYVGALLSRYCAFLFDPKRIVAEGSTLRLLIECSSLLELWVITLDRWIQDVIKRPKQSLTDDEKEDISKKIDEIESGSLFLLAHSRHSVHSTGVKAIRMLGILINHVFPEPSSPTPDMPGDPLRISEALLGKLTPSSYLNIPDDLLDSDDLVRLEQWRTSSKPDIALRLADSTNAQDQSLWRHVFPAVVQSCADYQPGTLPSFREKLTAAVTRYNNFITQLSGLNIRSPNGLPPRSASLGGDKEALRLAAESRPIVSQWHLWMKVLCVTAETLDVRQMQTYSNRDHSRGRSEVVIERDGLNTSRELFRYLSQFLDSDHGPFRDAAVSCISSFPAFAYSFLLEDLSTLSARQFYDDPRIKSSTPMIGRVRRQERFHTAVARIYYLTAHLIKSQRSSMKQAALSHVLKYIRSMQASLSAPENRDLFSLQRLRRYFCGTVERLFDGLASLNDSDRFIPAGMHVALYRMCEEWCTLGKQSDSVRKRLIVMQTAAVHSYQDSVGQAELIQRFQTETTALSHAAVGAMSALIQKAYYPPEITASPVDKHSSEQQQKSLEPGPTLDRLTALLASFHEPIQAHGKKALRAVLRHNPYDPTFADEVLRRAFVNVREIGTSNARFFEAVADVVCNADHGFKFCQVVCLGLSNLCHPLPAIRRQAFNMLETIHEQSSGILPMNQYEAAVLSTVPSTYLHAHRLISDVLSGEHPLQALNVLAQFSGWIPRMFEGGRADPGALILLQSLEFWVPSINLMVDHKYGLSRDGRMAVYHLVSLTLRYAESHPEQVLVLWTRLVDAPYQLNGHAVIRFLLEQSHKVGSTVFINCASKITACLSQSVIGRQLFEELCGVIEPARMLPSVEHKLALPDAEDLELWSDLDILFSEQPRLPLGMAQFSMLFLTETALERYWELQEQIPVLLHAVFMHMDHRQPFVRERSLHMLFQILRLCIPGYDELAELSMYPSRPELKASILALEQEAASRMWKDDDDSSKVESKMRWFAGQVLDLLEPLHPQLSEKWGSLALQWGTTCSIRPIAFRSLQFFRALLPKFKQEDLGLLLGRLSNTIADEDASIQGFNVEILSTLTAMVRSSEFDIIILPQLFWCAVAGLSTTVELEFQHVLGLLDALLTRVDLDDPRTADILRSQKPSDWRGSATMQSSLLMGLRSASTSSATFKLLQRLAKIDDPQLIDPSEGRIRDMYIVSLPWCLHAMSTDSHDESLEEFTMNIGRLAEFEERPSLTRIMTSFAKNRFRTKDDFLRQSIACLREHYGMDHWTEVLTLLVGLVLNKERWLRVSTMQILKVLFQQRETRTPVDRLGSELLMPLLRLLETDLASEALGVLEEPMQISGGPAAKHILRMSMHHHLAADAKEVESVAEVFGIAEESGWCVPRPGLLRDICRYNMGAVFDTCKVPQRPSRINFQPEEILGIPLSSEPSDDLGDLVQNLHELSTYFQGDEVSASEPTRQLEARVAAIMSKSTGDHASGPQTPLVDIFDMSSMSSMVGSVPSTIYDDSDDGSSPSDTESDLFEFDSPRLQRFTHINGKNH